MHASSWRTRDTLAPVVFVLVLINLDGDGGFEDTVDERATTTMVTDPASLNSEKLVLWSHGCESRQGLKKEEFLIISPGIDTILMKLGPAVSVFNIGGGGRSVALSSPKLGRFSHEDEPPLAGNP